MFIVRLEESQIQGASKVGNKAYNLALLKNALGLKNVPKSIVLVVHDEEDDAIASAEAVHTVNQLLGYPVIARSSTNAEDSAYSFAGLFVSEICRSDKELEAVIRDVLYSPKSDAVIQYCARRQIDHSSIRAAVLIQQYLSPQMAGVLFTKHPLTNDTTVAYIEYKEKSSDAVTSGSSQTKSLIVRKAQADLAQFPFNELISIGLRAEEYFGYPVDMEWILSNNQLWIVQVRQTTA